MVFDFKAYDELYPREAEKKPTNDEDNMTNTLRTESTKEEEKEDGATGTDEPSA